MKLPVSARPISKQLIGRSHQIRATSMFGKTVLFASMLVFTSTAMADYPNTSAIDNPTSAECRANSKLLTTNKINFKRVEKLVKGNNKQITTLNKQVSAKRKAFNRQFADIQKRLVSDSMAFASGLGLGYVAESNYPFLVSSPEPGNLSGAAIPLIDFSNPRGIINIFELGPVNYIPGDQSASPPIPDSFTDFSGASTVSVVFQAFKPFRGVPGNFYDSKLDNNNDGIFGADYKSSDPAVPVDPRATSDDMFAKFDVTANMDRLFPIPPIGQIGFTSEELDSMRARARTQRAKRIAEINKQGSRFYDLIIARDTLIKTFNKSALVDKLERIKKTVVTLSQEQNRLSVQKEFLNITKRNCLSAR